MVLILCLKQFSDISFFNVNLPTDIHTQAFA